MDHFFEHVQPKPRGNTVHMRTFAFDPWPADLLAKIKAMFEAADDEPNDGPRGVTYTNHGRVELDHVVGSFRIELPPDPAQRTVTLKSEG